MARSVILLVLGVACLAGAWWSSSSSKEAAEKEFADVPAAKDESQYEIPGDAVGFHALVEALHALQALVPPEHVSVHAQPTMDPDGVFSFNKVYLRVLDTLYNACEGV